MGHYRNFTNNRGQRSNGSTAIRSSQSSPHSTTRACPQTTEPVQRSPSLSPHNTPVHETDQNYTQAPSPHEGQAHYQMGELSLEKLLIGPGQSGHTKLDPKRPPRKHW